MFFHPISNMLNVFILPVNDGLFSFKPVKWSSWCYIPNREFRIFINQKTRQINANYSPFLGTTCNFG